MQNALPPEKAQLSNKPTQPTKYTHQNKPQPKQNQHKNNKPNQLHPKLCPNLENT